jgi:two-component system, chemotaxis family, protein-glutamate methylesterase/glutaminase
MEWACPGNAPLVVGPEGVVAIGGSAGSVEALTELVGGLPADLPATVLVTVHVGGNTRSRLPGILARSGPLPAAHARHGEPLRSGRIYVAPPDFHLLAADGVARLSSGPRVNRHRPAVDVMFASAARWRRTKVVAAVLSGVLDDGAVGAALVARAGGRVLAQDPVEALFDAMPRAAMAAVRDAVAVPTAEMADLIGRMAVEMADDVSDVDDGDAEEPEVAGMQMSESDDPGFLSADEARLTRLSCPECSGGLAEIDVKDIRFFRCHVGHQYSPQSLEAAQRESVEAKLWAAAAALEEHAALARHLAGRPESLGAEAAEGYREVADRSTDTARSLLGRLQGANGAAPLVDPR